MPIYEYQCSECQCEFELMRPLSKSSEPVDCPECKGKSKRVMSRFACFSTNDRGVSAPVGGGGCASCASGNCASCGG